jgi:chromosomal replication initiator protein
MTPEIAVGLPNHNFNMFVRSKKRNINDFKVSVIIDIVCKEFKVELSDLRSVSKKSTFRHPRHVAMHLLRHQSGLKLTDIGRLFGRHHTTVINALISIDNLLEFDKKIRNEYHHLQRLI